MLRDLVFQKAKICVVRVPDTMFLPEGFKLRGRTGLLTASLFLALGIT